MVSVDANWSGAPSGPTTKGELDADMPSDWRTNAEKDSLMLSQHLELPQESPLLARLTQRWNAGLRDAFEQLPRFDWEGPPKAS